MNLDNITPDDAPQAGTYRHYKGNLYQVFGTARHSETEEWVVVYQALYGEKGFWVRPLSIWLEPVNKDNAALAFDSGATKNNDSSANTVKRFEQVSSSTVSLTQLTKDLMI